MILTFDEREAHGFGPRFAVALAILAIFILIPVVAILAIASFIGALLTFGLIFGLVIGSAIVMAASK